MNGYHHLNGNKPSTGAGQPSTSTGDVTVPLGPTNQPRVHLRALNNTDAVFQLSGVETGYANSLRRVMMADVPTVGGLTFQFRFQGFCMADPSFLVSFIAIDQVLFMQNTSPVPDEMLAHRLGMVPLISRNAMDGLRYTRVSADFHMVMFLPARSGSLH